MNKAITVPKPNFLIEEINLTDGTKNGVDARKVHEYLEVGKDYSNWIKTQIKRLNLAENVDYIKIALEGDPITASGKGKIDYFVTIDRAKDIGLISLTAKGQAVRDYFVEAEKENRKVGTKENATIDYKKLLTCILFFF